MSACVTICPVGPVNQEILAHLARHIRTRCGLECRISPEMENPRYAYNETRHQYDSKVILKHLIRCCPHDTLRFIGVTPVDLYVPILKYVFGLAQIEGQCALISLHRLHPRFYDQPPDHDLLVERVKKTAVHELGHTFGLTHCRDRRCIMYSSTRIEDTDHKQSLFCPTCFELFKWHLEHLSV
ncbi:archaemetzincin family Zn-dependent metalloprotease [Desulfococcaceae bacterium HSG8]|nr:archaemetzincin family Zn-dependent metalloprotease [Desulfococcaceae bacterium HSG8]